MLKLASKLVKTSNPVKMAAEHILKIARSEGEGNFVMLNVKSKGSKPLDIALLATDGDSAWASSSTLDQ